MSSHLRSRTESREIDVRRHRQQDCEALDDHECGGADALNVKAVLQHCKQQGAQSRTDHGAGAAKQRSSANCQTPKIFGTIPSCGAGSGVLPARVRLRPCNRYRVPSVVMNDGNIKYCVTRPLKSPITAAMASPMINASHNCIPSLLRVTMTTGTRANVIPAERSISPQTRRNTSPAAISAAALKKFEMFWMLDTVKNSGFATQK